MTQSQTEAETETGRDKTTETERQNDRMTETKAKTKTVTHRHTDTQTHTCRHTYTSNQSQIPEHQNKQKTKAEIRSLRTLLSVAIVAHRDTVIEGFPADEKCTTLSTAATALRTALRTENTAENGKEKWNRHVATHRILRVLNYIGKKCLSRAHSYRLRSATDCVSAAFHSRFLLYLTAPIGGKSILSVFCPVFALSEFGFGASKRCTVCCQLSAVCRLVRSACLPLFVFWRETAGKQCFSHIDDT